MIIRISTRMMLTFHILDTQNAYLYKYSELSDIQYSHKIIKETRLCLQ